MKDSRQTIAEWRQLRAWFPDGTYRDIEGLCKIVTREEVAEQDHSLTPGRYVGVALDIDEDFDYQGRLAEINAELAQLNQEANALMGKILEVRR